MTVNPWLEIFSPFLIRILARDRSQRKAGAIREADIAAACGKTRKWLRSIEALDCWSHIPYGDIAPYLRATGIKSHLDFRKDRFYMLRSFSNSDTVALKYIDSLPPKERKHLLDLILQKAESLQRALSTLQNGS